MNIFVLSNCPLEAATMHCDKHIPKMIVETAQMLCTAIRQLTLVETPYKQCYINHPCNIWARESKNNFYWLLALGQELCSEYTKRFGKIHKTQDVITEVREISNSMIFKNVKQTPFALCMPDIYKNPQDAVTSYRNFYNGEKHFAKWQRNTPQPQWSTHGL